MRSNYFIPGIHILFWGLLFIGLSLIIPPVVFHNQPVDTGLPHNFFLITNIYHVGLFYFNAYFLYPRLVTKKGWWLYPFAIAGILWFSYHMKLFFLNLLQPGFEPNSLNKRILLFAPVPFLMASFIYSLVANRIRSDKLEKEKKTERLNSELKFLRSQVSPHFLFNMMTNMISLARQKSDQLEPSLIKLSELLRYMLYEPDQKRFPVIKEMAYLKSYIELQEMRFGEDVRVRVESEFDTTGCFIEPMLLVPFVENAFKHGIGLLKDPYIDVTIRIKNQHLFFRVINNYNKENLSKDKNPGIGLGNVQNRLKLLYPGRYTLDLNDSGEIYQIELNLDLS